MHSIIFLKSLFKFPYQFTNQTICHSSTVLRCFLSIFKVNSIETLTLTTVNKLLLFEK